MKRKVKRGLPPDEPGHIGALLDDIDELKKTYASDPDMLELTLRAEYEAKLLLYRITNCVF